MRRRLVWSIPCLRLLKLALLKGEHLLFLGGEQRLRIDVNASRAEQTAELDLDLLCAADRLDILVRRRSLERLADLGRARKARLLRQIVAMLERVLADSFATSPDSVRDRPDVADAICVRQQRRATQSAQVSTVRHGMRPIPVIVNRPLRICDEISTQ